VLARVELLGVPLLVHPGPASVMGDGRSPADASLRDPLWWPALTRYVAQMQASWLAFVTAGRAEHRDLRVVFAMLAGLAPLHGERLRARGGLSPALDDPLVFYDTSSYGPAAIGQLAAIVGPQQLVYGSDRPVVEPDDLNMPRELDWDPIIDATNRALDATDPAWVR
jgi:predicted TIM-barrel fold metal-dependent hydrolase